MIWVVAGTRDARQLIEKLEQKRIKVLATVVSDYGEQLLRQQASADLRIFKGALTPEGMITFVQTQQVRAIVDATHPYAQVVSSALIDVARQCQIPYLRYERASSQLPEAERLKVAATWDECLAWLQQLPPGQGVFLATGSRKLPDLVPALQAMGHRPVVRILPDPEQVALCLQMGLSPAQVIAMQGPFSADMNRAMFQQVGADCLVTKDSGHVGGALDKIEPALALGMDVIVVGRPSLAYPEMTDDAQHVLNWVAHVLEQPAR
ncbi:precorrin-6A reductase [Heliophilum fasciatum]|uniref:Precorrin-6A/cobalt-precorrin-6A reductase n=1 Tax=Heliophilum fasciatum TaxID=35700 RepID=A0A4R2RI94_9FIRM|nr:precorrin-6A reductase [Heliophilum fasciatum]MCW2278535.1 precorrin-6A/cobalt-precorrin-6A reductase [Heliophilum fasciatum]TCP63490.1 precorrin-6A/cobalt-precorrin-6A reductase [Heliophilum fasciatum]